MPDLRAADAGDAGNARGKRFAAVSPSVDDVSSGRIGQWLGTGGSLGVADALAVAAGAVAARAPAAFRAA